MTMNKMSIERKIISVTLPLLICSGLLSAAQVTAYAQDTDSYKKQFDFYVDSAANAGLIPNFKGSLDEPVSEGDFFDFIFKFLEVKCGIDVDTILLRARSSLSPEERAEERAKVKVINFLMGKSAYWEIMRDGELDDKLDLDTALVTFQHAAHKYIAPFPPLIYQLNNHNPLERYNFQNDITVVYHEDVVLALMSEIIGLSRGQQKVKLTVKDSATRRQFAAFCYVFSTMSLPRDMSSKYQGGVSGDKRADDFVADILDKVIKQDMTNNQKIKAVYDYLIYNFEHDKSAVPIINSRNRNSANPLSSTISLAMPILTVGKGTCDAFANIFRLLAIRLGYESNYVSGQYVNRDGTKYGHGWNQIKVDDEWYWLDVDTEGTVFRREKNPKPSYFLFMKKDKDWTFNHQWNKSDWPSADSTKHRMALSWYGKPDPIKPPSLQKANLNNTFPDRQPAPIRSLTSSDYAPGRIIVGFKDDVSEQDADNLIKSHKLSWTSDFPTTFFFWVKVVGGSSDQHIRQLEQSDLVSWTRQSNNPKGNRHVPYIGIQFNEKATENSAHELVQSIKGLEFSSKVAWRKGGIVHVPRGEEQKWIRIFEEESIVRYAEPDYIVRLTSAEPPVKSAAAYEVSAQAGKYLATEPIPLCPQMAKLPTRLLLERKSNLP